MSCFWSIDGKNGHLTAHHLDQRTWEEWEISKATARKEDLLDANGIGDFVGMDFGKLGLNLLLSLDVKHPRAVNLSESGTIPADEALVSQIWAYLRRQGIVHGEVAEGSLTVSGRQSLHTALGAAAEFGIRQIGPNTVPAGRPASMLLLTVMRHHFGQQVLQP